jgi:hypothetical protein
MRSASISIQIQHAVAPSSIRWPSACRATLVVPAKTNATPASSAALTSFGVRGTQRWCGHRFNASVAAQSARWLRAALQSAAVQVQGGGFSARVVASPSSACSQVGQATSSAVLSRLPSRVASGKNEQRGPSPAWLLPHASARFSYSWAMSPTNPALPNPSFKRSPNSVARWPSSAGAAPHFALAVQRATLPGPA